MFRRPSLALNALLALMCTGCLTTFDADGVEIQGADDAPDAGNNAPQNNQPQDRDAAEEDDATADAEEDDAVEGDAVEGDAVEPVCVEGEPCTPFPGTLGICEEGECVASGCDDGFLDCNDALDTDGCETDSTTIMNCGACLNACTGGNAANWSCVDGQCAIDECDPAFADADGVAENGCEARRPPIPVITSADTRDHSMLVGLAPPPGAFQPALIEFAWEQFGVPRRTKIINAATDSAILGPIERPGEVTFTVRYEDAQGLSSDPSEGFSTNFVPAGWYNRSMARFFLDARLQGPNDGFIVGFGFSAHVREGGSRLIPGRVPSQVANLGFDMVVTPPLEGLGVTCGFLGEVLVTQNNGLTWERRTVTADDPNDVSFLQQALVLPDGTIYVTGLSQNVYVSEDGGDTWDTADIPAPFVDRWQGMAKVVTDGPTGVFVAGDSSQTSQNVVAVSFDDGDTWEVFDLTPSNSPDAIFNDHFAVTMLDENVGFIGSTAGILTTSDGWRNVELVALPGQDTLSGPIRIRFQEDRLFGVATGEDNQGWYTTDGGQSWAIIDDVILQSDTAGDPVWAMAAPIPGSDPPAFLLGNDRGDLKRVSLDDNNTLASSRLQAGRDGDLIGVVSWNNFDDLRAFTSDGLVLQGAQIPESFSALGNIDVARGNERGDARLNSVAASDDGAVILAVGNHRVAQLSTDGGRRWIPLIDPQEGLNLIAVDLTADGERGLAVGADSTNEAFIYNFNNRTQNFSRISNEEINRNIDLDEMVPTALDIHPVSGAAAIVFQNSAGEHVIFKNDESFQDDDWGRVDLLIGDTITGMSVSESTNLIWLIGENQTLARVDGARLSFIDFERSAIERQINFNLTFIAFSNDGTKGWFATNLGWIHKTTDGGETWSFDKATSAFDGDYVLRDITFTPDHQHALIVGDDGATVWTANGGIPNPAFP